MTDTILDDLPPLYTDEDIESARRDGESAGYLQGLEAGKAELLPDLFSSEVRLQAQQAGAAQLADLAGDWLVASRVLGFDDIPTDGAGRPDRGAITEAIAAAVEARPWLASTDTKPAGDRPAAQQGRATGGGYLTRGDLQHMTPDEIVEAKQSGRLDDLLQGRTT